MAPSDARSYLLAAKAATEIVLQKLEILLSHPVCGECLLMRTCVNDAKARLAIIQEILSPQDTRPRPMEPMVWLRWILHAMSDAEEFIDKFHLREAHKRHEALHTVARPFAELISKYKLRRDLSILVKKMGSWCNEKFLKEEAKGKRENEPDSSSSRARVPWQGKKLARLTNFWDRQAPMNFICHAAKKEEIMKRIKTAEPTIQGTSIWGGQGTGKTFLARWIYSQAKYMDYEGRAWVHLSGSLDKREFLLEILKQVGKLTREMKDMDIVEIKKMLLPKFAEAKGFLIVLDDVQPSNKPLLQELVMSILFFSHVYIITTTRDHEVALLMNSSNAGPIKLENLDPEKSRRMLAWKLHRVPDDLKLSPEENSILNMCCGLPLYISLLGGFLLNAGEHERKALAKEGSMMTLLDILQFSCHKLPDHLIPCFIYMALIPVAFPIPTRRLVRLWLAEGLLDSYCHDIESKRTRLPEDVGETFILELADRNVIDVVSWRTDGSPKACQMLTSLYDMIRLTAISAGFIHIHAAIRNPTGRQQQLPTHLLERTKIRWFAEHTSIVTDSHRGSFPDLYLGHVRSFLSFYMKRGILSKDISTFLGNTTSKTAYSLLRVLDLEGVHKPSLQGVLHKLVFLRYLGLRSTVLDSLPSVVVDLHHLETLDIKHTNITFLPSSFWKARSLRHLHLNWFYINLNTIFEACSNNVMALTRLQTLSGLVIGEHNENLMRDHLDSSTPLTTLTTLKLYLRRSGGNTSGDGGKAVADWISFRLTNLQSLTFGVTQKANPKKEVEPATEVEHAEGAEPTEQAQPVREVEHAEGAQPMTEVEHAEGAKPAEEAQPVTEVEHAEGAKPAEEAQPVTEVEHAEGAKPAEEAQPGTEVEHAEGAEPARSQIGPLPKLSLAEHDCLLDLYLLGQLDKPIWKELLPGSLRVLTLSYSKVEKDMMPELGGLLTNLRTLRLLANSFLGSRLTFIKDGFPSLKILKIWKLPMLQEVTIQQGAMPHLKELEFRHLDLMTKAKGINHCTELESICVSPQRDDLVKRLKDQIKGTTILYKSEGTKRPGFTNDDKK